MNDLQTQLQAAKARLSAAAVACFSGAPGAAHEADEALAETERLLRETPLKRISTQKRNHI